MTETTPEKNGATDVSGSTNKKKADINHWWFHLNREALGRYADILDQSILVDSVRVPVPVHVLNIH